MSAQSSQWRVETCYDSVALVDERGILVAHFREPNATANALKVAALLSQVARLRTALKRCERVVTWCKESGMEGSQITRAQNEARALLAETEGKP